MHGHAAPYYAEGIHIIMSRRTGLPHSDFFVEFPTESQAEEALELTRMKDYKTCKSSQKELMGALFPNFHSNDIDSEEHNGTLIMVRDECEFLVSECRRIRLRRVNCERPFENIISILSKFPWHHPERISTLQRDHIFEMVKRNLKG